MGTASIVIRTDASPAIGTGHVMRCLTLADTLQARGAGITFVCRHLPSYLHERIVAQGCRVALLPEMVEVAADDRLDHSGWLGCPQEIDARDTVAALAGRGADWLVVDHYALDVRWESALRPVARRLMVIDDLADRDHDCDLLLDQNLHEDMHTRYTGHIPAHCRMLAGPRYALLRPGFARLHDDAAERHGPLRRLLVFFGGIDADDHTGRALQTIPDDILRSVAVDVVLGAAHPRRREIESLCGQRGFACHVQTDRMAELMAGADLAIGAGGIATWERCCVGLPALAFSTAQNQRQQVSAAATAGLVYAPDDTTDFVEALRAHLPAVFGNARLRQAMSRAALRAVDGRGVFRVCRELGWCGIDMRRATADDSDALFAWRNHPSIRAVSRHPEPIDRATHDAWLNAVLQSSQRYLLIGESAGIAVGVVRFDLQGDEAEVSIYRVPGALPEIAGGDLLRSAERWLGARLQQVCKIRAEVLGDNEASRYLFLTAGYRPEAARYSRRLHPDE